MAPRLQPSGWRNRSGETKVKSTPSSISPRTWPSSSSPRKNVSRDCTRAWQRSNPLEILRFRFLEHTTGRIEEITSDENWRLEMHRERDRIRRPAVKNLHLIPKRHRQCPIIGAALQRDHRLSYFPAVRPKNLGHQVMRHRSL